MMGRALVLILGLSGCLSFTSDGDAPPDPVAVVAISPADSDVDVEPAVAVVATLSGPVDGATLELGSSDGAEISGALSASGGALTFQPDRLLDLERGFTATATAPAGALSASFTTRAGQWEAPIDVAPGSAVRATAINDRGEVAFAWLVSGELSAAVGEAPESNLGPADSGPEIALAADGTADMFAVVAGQLTSWRFAPDAGWGPPEPIGPATRFSTATGVDGEPIAVFADGSTLSISWRQETGWTAPVSLVTGDPLHTFTPPRAAVAADGSVAAVWAEELDTGGTNLAASVIAPGGQWAAATPLEDNPDPSSPNNALSPVIAAAGDGFVTAWDQGQSVMVSANPGLGWSSPTAIAAGPGIGRPSIAATPAGPVLAWPESSTALIARHDGDAFGPVEIVGTGESSIDRLTIAADRHGRLFAVLESGDLLDQDLTLFREQSDGSWALEIDLAPESDNARLAVAPRGAAVLLYEDGPLRARRFR